MPVDESSGDIAVCTAQDVYRWKYYFLESAHKEWEIAREGNRVCVSKFTQHCLDK